ncbi:MAG: hypothetical protein ACPGJS_21500 [Flammeovirgaceae bacterium]
MALKLGKVVEQGCYKGDKRVGNAKYLHNCVSEGGDNVQWKFEVVDGKGVLQGHVIASLGSSFQGNETQQKAQIIKIANEQIPKQ